MAHPANAAADGNAQLAPCLAAIVPVFNEAATVGRVIERVLAQRPIQELVIVDVFPPPLGQSLLVIAQAKVY
jgi:hypothetical protein